MAVESGSRVWGFSSANSDYDIRFIFKQSLENYLTLGEPLDHITKINKELDLDFSGWDLKKYLGLLYKGNVQALEWVYSPQVYQGMPGVQEDLQNLAMAFYSPIASYHHYLHLSESEYKSSKLQAMPNIKSYLYIIKGLLSCKYIELFNNPPPLNIKDLLLLTEHILDVQIVHEINSLITRKINSSERTSILQNHHLNTWIENQLEIGQEIVKTLTKTNKPDINILNEYFYSQIKEK